MKKLSILFAALLIAACGTNKSSVRDGNKYVPYDQRSGDEAVVYFTRNLSPEGLIAAYEQVNGEIAGKVAVKLHTGEKTAPISSPAHGLKNLLRRTFRKLLSSRPTLTTRETVTQLRSIAKPWR